MEHDERRSDDGPGEGSGGRGPTPPPPNPRDPEASPDPTELAAHAYRSYEALRRRASALSRRLEFFRAELRRNAREVTELVRIASEPGADGEMAADALESSVRRLERSLTRYEEEMRDLEAERDRLRAYLDRLHDLLS